MPTHFGILTRLMEPTAISTGRPGSLENPEVYDNVPGHIIPILEKEFDDFDERAEGFLAGKEAEDTFIGFRLKQGVYGQRQADRQMMRIKLPLGGVTPDQMDAFARVAEEFTPLVKGHITTRQNFQFHHIPLSETQKVLRILGEVGLSSREACGNTVRNVTGDPWAGVCDDELYDITPYGAAFVRYFVRNGWLRANRARARLKFLVDKIGIDEFRELVDEELKGDWVDERDFDPSPLLFEHDESEHAPGPYTGGSPNGDSREFDGFVASTVKPQRQEDFPTVEVKVE